MNLDGTVFAIITIQYKFSSFNYIIERILNMLPIIGITSNYFDTSNYVPGSQITPLPDQCICTVAEDYIISVRRAGGVPIVLPVTNDLDMIIKYVDFCDGIILIGAAYDVDPRRYGEELIGKVNKPVEKADNFDITLTSYIVEHSKKPFLGICRGCQIINVALGGSLYIDVESAGFENHCFLDKGKENPQHKVTVQKKDSILYRIFGQDRIAVNSLHHQAIKDLAPDLTATSLSDDGLVESCELNDNRFVIGLQWHPEMMQNSKPQQQVFIEFVRQCLK